MGATMNKRATHTPEQFEFIKKQLIKGVSVGRNGEQLFNPDKYNEMCEIVYDENGTPTGMAIKLKRLVNNKIVEEKVLANDYSVKELSSMINESANLGDFSLFTDQEDLEVEKRCDTSNIKKGKGIKLKIGKTELSFNYNKSNA